MNKNLILITVILISCNRSKLVSSLDTHSSGISSIDKNLTSYKVYKIDSINNFYLIYAKKEASLFKIVSQKGGIKNCNRIKKNAEYNFYLHSHLENSEILPQNSLLVNCFYYDDSTAICLERDSINDLHYADNIKGLCFIK